MPRSNVLLVALTVSVFTAGCAAEKHEFTCEPKLQMADLATGLPTPDNTFTLLSDQRTVGRFACVLAVAKLAPHEQEPGRELGFQPLRPQEEAQWTEAVRGLSSIRYVLFLTPKSLRLVGDDRDGLCTAAQRLGASLLLIYVPNTLGPNSAQVLGMLYDLESRAPLATFHASARFLDDDDQETTVDPHLGDQRHVDARYQAQRQIEQHVVACLRNLIEHDQPAPTTKPRKRWDRPFTERWWMPEREH